MAVPRPIMTPLALTVFFFLIALLIFWSALFSGLETALFSLKSHQLRRLEEKHPSLKEFISVFRQNPRRVTNVLLLGDVFAYVTIVLLCRFLICHRPTA